MEYARNQLGIEGADHAESGDPGSSELIVTRLECSLVGEVQTIRIVDGSQTSLAYGSASTAEELRCGFGLNPDFRQRLEASPLRVVGTSDAHTVRIVELPEHQFYVATLFLPQLASRPGRPHPLDVAFVRRACENRSVRTAPGQLVAN